MTKEEASLTASLEVFVRAYQANAALVAEQRGWNLTIALAATDVNARVRLRLQNGMVVGRDDAAPADLLVSAALTTLQDVLELRCDPNEPYLFGELTVTGPEADFLRLDYIASRLCAR